MGDRFDKTDRNTVKRVPKRGAYDKQTLYDVIDKALVCHVAIVGADGPVVIPMVHARLDDEVLLHGATSSRVMRHLADSLNQISISFVHLDGLVLARSLYNHSVNYRSAVVFGRGRLLADDEKLPALERLVAQIIPGRLGDARDPSEAELRGTSVVAVKIESGSAKIRTGPPIDDEQDHALPHWAGVLPITECFRTPEPDNDRPTPDYVTRLVGRRTDERFAAALDE